MKRFKLLCILLLLVIFAGIMQSFFVDFMGGFGFSGRVMEYSEKTDKNYNSFVAVDVVASYPKLWKTNEINTLTGDSILIIPEEVSMLVPIGESEVRESAWSKTLRIMNNMLSFFIFFVNVFTLMCFVRIIIVFTRKDFFDKRIIRWLTIVGWLFVIESALLSLWHLIKMHYTMRVIELSMHDISFGSAFDFESLTTGLIVLVVSEILKYAITMKQEQDLTI